MRVALVTNALDGGHRGNRSTLERWRAHLPEVEIVPVDARCATWEGPPPDLVHGYHALHGAVPGLALARSLDRPLVVSLGGTDLFALATQAPGAAQVDEVLRASRVVTGAFAAFGERLARLLGATIDYAVVPRGVDLPEEHEPLPREGRLRLLLPAGLRAVKQPLLAIDLAARLAERGLPLELSILGPALEAPVAAEVARRAAGLAWVSIGERPHPEMGRVYAATDVVWNTSLHEGGANALLEAAAHGCALLARDVPGNRELLREPGAPGALFDPDDFEFVERFHRALLAETEAHRRARAASARAWLKALHDPEQEAAALREAYARALG